MRDEQIVQRRMIRFACHPRGCHRDDRVAEEVAEESERRECAFRWSQSLEIAPQRLMHHAELAHVYKQMGKHDLELQEWQNTLGIKAQDSDDENYQKEARAALDTARKSRGTDGTKLTSQR